LVWYISATLRTDNQYAALRQCFAAFPSLTLEIENTDYRQPPRCTKMQSTDAAWMNESIMVHTFPRTTQQGGK
jgi:hypothetical protein